MRELILEKLNEIEERENIKILHIISTLSDDRTQSWDELNEMFLKVIE